MRIFFITDSEKFDPVVAAGKLPRGAFIILRDYEHSDRESLARQLKKVCRARGLKLLIAGDAKLAMRVGADGIHLPEYLSHEARKWKKRKPNWIVSVAAHNKNRFHQREDLVADFYLFSPVFETISHPGQKPQKQPQIWRFPEKKREKIIALGGINQKTITKLAFYGYQGFAGISTFS